MLIRCVPNITIRVGISTYKLAGEETGQVDLPHLLAPNSTGTGKVSVPL